VGTGTDSIKIDRLRELWVHTGTACNLSCPFCHEGSRPGDDRLQAPTLEELAPLLRDAAARGVERFAFTGGEPLILKGIHDILLFALQLAPVLVLTNGTAPFIRRAHQLATLRAAPHAVNFRVSIDYPDETRHDAGRGFKNFRKAMEGLRLLHAGGFAVGITRQREAGEDERAVANAFRNILRRQRLPEDLPIVALPELGLPQVTHEPNVRTSATTSLLPWPSDAPEPGCARSRMALRRDGSLRFQACPLTDDDRRFEVGSTLEAALAAGIRPDHPRCQRCRDPGVNYAGS
jgi:hypothetical protein